MRSVLRMCGWAVAFSAWAVRSSVAVEPLGDLTGPWQLFVDDHAIEQRAGLTRTYHPFQKYAGNPVIRADRPWEGTVIYMYGNVLPNEDRTGYRIWYHSLPKGEGNRLLYAESADGINWVKPNLGNVLYNGSTNNNIYFQRTTGDHIASVIHTPWDTPDRQYKLMNYNGALGGFLGAWSANGTDFTSDPANPLVTGTGDVGNFVYDFHRDEYLGYVKLNTYVGGLRRRCVAITRTPQWTAWPPAYIVIKPDALDDTWGIGLNKTDFYGLCGFAYESMYVGFLWVLRVTDYIDVCQDGPIFVQLVTSRDGVNWKREEGSRPAILPVGGPGAWDRGMVFTAQQPLVENGQIKLYYGGIDDEHCASNWNGGIGLATLRKDGFASLDAGGTLGSLTTSRLLNATGELRLNYSASAGGAVRVEVLDADGQVVPGFSQAECTPLQGDSVDQAVQWASHAVLPDTSPLRLRFALQNASLYSFRTAEPVVPLQPPAILDQPDVQRVEQGQAAEFSIAAAGDAPLAYRWQKNGVDLGDDGRYSGTATGRLRVAAVTADDVAAYRCVVTNPGGSTASDAADLKVGHWIFSVATLPGETSSSVSGMSNDGSVICGASGNRAFIWTASQGVRDLGLPANADAVAPVDVLVRQDGSLAVAVNVNHPTATRTVRWDGTIGGDGQYVELPALAGPRYWSTRGMGTDGTEIWMVGSAAGGEQEAVVYRYKFYSIQLASLPNSASDPSSLNAVSDWGDAAGECRYGGTRSGFLRTRRSASVMLNSLAGTPGGGSQAVALCISRDGEVQGGWSYAAGSSSLHRPVIWRDPATLVSIPLLAVADAGEVHAMSGDGSVVAGTMWDSGDPVGSARAFVWDAVAGTRSLASAFSAWGVEIGDWVLQDVTDMSADGTMFCGNGLSGGEPAGWGYTFFDQGPSRPLILQHPKPQSAAWGQSVVFRVEAVGEAPLTYRWQRDWGGLEEGDDFSGSTTPTLTVRNVRSALAALYRCVVTNSQGTIVSNSASLTFLTPASDFDQDGDVDLVDWALLQRCLSGPTTPQPSFACRPARLDADEDVDQEDARIFLKCLGGPDVIADLGCAD